MPMIYERRGSLPPDPGRTGGRPKGPRQRWQRPDEARPGPRHPRREAMRLQAEARADVEAWS